jgi:hypothetical protein
VTPSALIMMFLPHSVQFNYRNNAVHKEKKTPHLHGVLVSINDMSRCDILCDNGAYEVDVPASDLRVIDSPAAGVQPSRK